MIAIATNTTFTEFEHHLRSLVSLLDQDGPHDPNEERRRSKLSIRHTPDRILINGELVRTLAAPVASREQLLAEALVDLRRNRATPAHGPVIEMTVIVTDTEPGRGEATDGVPVEGDSLDMCACDPILRVVTLDQCGEPLNVGRARRLATDTQRHAAKIRDHGCAKSMCAGPGCDAPVEWTELHHVQHWRHGGTTDLDNLSLTERGLSLPPTPQMTEVGCGPLRRMVHDPEPGRHVRVHQPHLPDPQPKPAKHGLPRAAPTHAAA